MITRMLARKLKSAKKSILLLGPRQVGKSTLIGTLQPEFVINLADEVDFLRYSSQPGTFKSDVLESGAGSVFVDEIQRIPNLLHTIQTLIDSKKGVKFFLTGSSARKLKRGQANLLPGRVCNFHLGPLVARELDYRMATRAALEVGCLPEPYLTKNREDQKRILKSYAGSYLKEEIQAEALVRNLDSFARFFQEASVSVGDFVDFTKMAKRSKISRHAIPRYFEILEDTLIGHRVFPYSKAAPTLDLVKHPKFYFFDNGVYNGLLGNFTASPDRIGRLAEQLIFSQLLHSAWAAEKDIRISTFRTRRGVEVDFIVELEGRTFAVEVKTSDGIQSEDLEGLRFFAEHHPHEAALVLHLGSQERKFGAIRSLPWQKGLQAMGL